MPKPNEKQRPYWSARCSAKAPKEDISASHNAGVVESNVKIKFHLAETPWESEESFIQAVTEVLNFTCDTALPACCLSLDKTLSENGLDEIDMLDLAAWLDEWTAQGYDLLKGKNPEQRTLREVKKLSQIAYSKLKR